MDKSYIQQKIYYYQNAIDNCSKNTSRLEQQVEELQILSNKLDTFKRNFDSKQSVRKSKLLELQDKENMINAISTYCVGMSLLLSNREYTYASDGIETAKKITDKKKKEIESQISAIKKDMNKYQNKLTYRKYLLEIYKNSENEG